MKGSLPLRFVFTAVGDDNGVMKLTGASTRIIDLKGRRVLPGLIDSHLHIIRGALNFNMELRWEAARRSRTRSRRPVCTENLIRVDDALETPKLAE